MMVSENVLDEVRAQPQVEITGDATEIEFDDAGALKQPEALPVA